MNIKCSSCGRFYEEAESKCPFCGAANSKTAQQAMPQTIDELRAFCYEKGMPLKKMRFFIGEDCREPKAFGIYRGENDRFIVYKNKADGSRAVRYEGPDEAYAVKELYLKLQSEVQLRRESGELEQSLRAYSQPARVKAIRTAALVVLVLAVMALFRYLDADPRHGYYCYDDSYYYYQDGWYGYDDALHAWVLTEALDGDWLDEADDYYAGAYYDDEYAIDRFEDSDYYSEDSSDSLWDNDYGSWDMDSTDWSSDW